MGLYVSQLVVYPIKSGAPIALPSAWAGEQGLEFDRRFVVCSPEGDFITGRKDPELLHIVTTLRHDGVSFSYPDMVSISLSWHELAEQRESIVIWKASINGASCPARINEWFSAILKRPVKLVFHDSQANYTAGRAADRPVVFADGYPILVTNTASLDAINNASMGDFSMRRFRPNLVLSGGDAWAEDSWQRMRIGEVELECVKPCERCILITRDPISGERHPKGEPLKTLAKLHRSAEGKVCFGQNVMIRKAGIIQMGDQVELID